MWIQFLTNLPLGTQAFLWRLLPCGYNSSLTCLSAHRQLTYTTLPFVVLRHTRDIYRHGHSVYYLLVNTDRDTISHPVILTF